MTDRSPHRLPLADQELSIKIIPAIVPLLNAPPRRATRRLCHADHKHMPLPPIPSRTPSPSFPPAPQSSPAPFSFTRNDKTLEGAVINATGTVPLSNVSQDVADQISYELQLLAKQNISPSQHLLNLCKQGQWITISNLLAYVDASLFDLNIVSTATGWTPLMFAAKENRVNIADKFIKMGYDVNAQAKVSKVIIEIGEK